VAIAHSAKKKYANGGRTRLCAKTDTVSNDIPDFAATLVEDF